MIAEHALDPRYAKIVGVDLDNLMVSQPESGEDALNITETLYARGIDVIVVDSVAALVSRQELDGQMGDTTVGLQARMMSQAMRRLTAAISKTNCVCIFTTIRKKSSHVRQSRDHAWWKSSLKFFCSIRMDIRRIGQIKESNGTVTGSRTRLKVVKNKVAPPFTACEFDIMYDEGISRTGSVVDLGIEHNILTKKGAWISYEGDLVGQGREAAKQALMENPELMEKITSTILEKVEVSVGSVLAQSKDDNSD